MKNKITFIIIVLAIATAILFSPGARTLPGYTIDGNKVYIDDTNIYLSAEPHTIHSRGYVYFNFTSKVYSGDADFIFGFDTDKLTPERLELYNPLYYNKTEKYTCSEFFNYTTTPKHAWCFETKNGTLTQVFEHNFDYGNVSAKTIYWNETDYQEWQGISKILTKINYEYGGMDTWYYAQNIPITSGRNYYLRGIVDVPQQGFIPESIDTKYWVAIKPSSETIQQAISNGHLYYLDPWVNSSGGYNATADTLDDLMLGYWKFDESSGANAADTTNYSINGTAVSGNNWIGGVIRNAYQCTGSPQYLLMNTSFHNLGPTGSVAFWINFSSFNTNDAVIYGKGNWGPAGSYYAYISSSGLITFKAASSSADLTQTARTNYWEHYVWTFNGTAHILYKNGVLNKTQAVNPASLTGNTIQLKICGGIGGMNYDDFVMDEFAVWNRTLTPGEAALLYNQGAGLTYVPSLADTTPPSVTIVSPQQNYSVTTIDFNVTISEAGACDFSLTGGVNNYTMLADGTNTKFGYTNNSIGDGSYTARFYCNDTVGNKNDTASTKFLVDTIYPYIAYSAPTEDNNTNSTKNYIFVNTTIIEANIANITFKLSNDAGIVNTTIYFSNINFINWSIAANGNYYYNVSITDALNHINTTDTRKITIDTNISIQQGYTGQPPSGSGGYAPAVNNSFFKNATVNFTANVSDITGISNITITIINVSGGTTNITATYSPGIFNTLFGYALTLADGIYRWFIGGIDVLNNIVYSTVLTLFIDTTPPVFASQNYTMSWNNDTILYKLNMTLTELYPNVTGISFEYLNNTIYNITSSIYEYNFTKIIEYAPYSSNFYWWAIDNATNYNQSNNFYFNINCPAPWRIFNNTYCMERIVFSSNENKTRYLNISQNYILTSAYINFSGFVSGYSAGETTLDNSTKQSSDTGILNPFYGYDLNWTTYPSINCTGLTGEVTKYVFENYTSLNASNIYNLSVVILSGATGCTQQNASYFNGTGYVSFMTYPTTNSVTYNPIPYEAYKTGNLSLRMDVFELCSGVGVCTSNGYAELNVTYISKTYPNNASLNVNNHKVWSYAGPYNISNNQTSNIAQPINYYLSSCAYSGGQCNIPFVFHSDTPGILRYYQVEYSNVGLLENSINYSIVTHETKPENFILNMTYDNNYYSSIFATFYYNGTPYTTTNIGAGSNPLFKASLNIPVLASGLKENKTIYWTVQLSNTSGSYYYNTSAKQQTVEPLIFQRCNDTYPVILVNYSYYNESDLAKIDAGLLGTWSYSLQSSLYKTYSFSNKTMLANHSFCTNVNETFSVNAALSVYIGDFYKNYGLINETYNATTTEKKLYILSSGGTNVIIQVRDSSMFPLSNYQVLIYRYYPQNDEYILITEDTTDLYGQIVATLVENTVKYKFVFKDPSGQIVKTSTGVTIACKAAICILPFIIEDTTDDFDRFKNATNYSWSFNFDNNTNIFTYTWNDLSSSSAVNNLLVERYLFNGTEYVCNETTTNTSGTLTCNVGSQAASYTAQAFRTTSGVKKRIAEISAKVGNIAKKFGKEGLIMAFFLLMTCLTFGYFKPTAGIFLYGIGFLLLSFSNIIYVNPAILAAEGVIIVVFLWAFKG